jgi:hypothetical protein
MYIIIGAAGGGGLLLITIIIVSVICCKKTKKIENIPRFKQSLDLEHDSMKKLDVNFDPVNSKE